jgi:hypothetical protein
MGSLRRLSILNMQSLLSKRDEASAAQPERAVIWQKNCGLSSAERNQDFSDYSRDLYDRALSRARRTGCPCLNVYDSNFGKFGADFERKFILTPKF